ncbi:hypothetical protein GQ44DRAFT_776484 [Phaeosphaeriaceae sp. PMI808]|nr:hypothetical protein GQ44DRAFT_776484 [Phaeosphaeriaceae sp. PMI808]
MAGENLLLKVPGEIRNRIYHYAFEGAKHIINDYGVLDDPRAPGLVLSCRKIYEETSNSLYLFTHATFSSADKDCLDYWISRLSERQRNAIQSVELQCTPCLYYPEIFGPPKRIKIRWPWVWWKMSPAERHMLEFKNLPSLKRITVMGLIEKSDERHERKSIPRARAMVQWMNPRVEVTSEYEVSDSLRYVS